MKKVLTLISTAVILLTFTACNFNFPLIKPLYNDSEKVIAEDGMEFTILRREDNVPDQEIAIIAWRNEKVVFSYVAFSNHLDDYNYQNDFVENYAEIIGEYRENNICAYQFNWGIIYSLDDGASFVGVPKHQYIEICSNDPQFKAIYDTFHN